MCGHLWVPVDDVEPPGALDPPASFELFELPLPVVAVPVEVVVVVAVEPALVDEPEELPVLAVVAEPELPFEPEDPALVAALAIAAPPRTNPPARAPITMALRTGDFMFLSFPVGPVGRSPHLRERGEYAEPRCEPAHERRNSS